MESFMAAKKQQPKEPKSRGRRPSGGAWMKAAGLTAVNIGLTSEQVKLIDQACAFEKRTRANFLSHYALPAAVEAAQAIIEKAEKL
jgi:uncharacterized protein (DUF1778 family)